MQYTTGAEQAPRNAERTGWAIDDNRVLSFGGSDKFLACPGGPNNSFRDPKAADPDTPAVCYYTTE